MIILLRGGGDLASGVALALHKAGWPVVITELANPLVVRRAVAFGEAIFAGEITVEGVRGVLAHTPGQAREILAQGYIAVIVDPGLDTLNYLPIGAIVDARMLKRHVPYDVDTQLPVIGLGPGFEVGFNCAAAIETNRGPELGRLFLEGEPQPDTGVASVVEGRGMERVLYSPRAGEMNSFVSIGDIVTQGQVIATVGGEEVRAPFDGVVRGLIRDGLVIPAHTKVGDVDPRLEPRLAYEVSDKAHAVGEAVVRHLESSLKHDAVPN